MLVITETGSVRPPTVLLVEDSTDTRLTLRRLLEAHGCRVVEACDGAEAIGVAVCTRPDLVLMDLNMPRLDGLAATERLHSQPGLGDVPVVAITAYDTYGIEDEARAAGCSGYLRKPIDEARVERLLREHLPTV